MARNSFILGQAGVDIDLVGATIHNYNHDWVGVTGETTPQPGQSVAYGEGDIVFHRDALWVALRANDNIEPSTSDQDWAQIATGSGSTIERWSASPGVYQTDEIVIYIQNNVAQLYIWEGTNPSTPTDVPGVNTDWQQLSGHGGSTLSVNGGVGIIVQPGSNSVTVSLSETVDQAMTFNDTVRVDGNIDSGGNITTANGTMSSAIASFGQMNSVEANTRTLDVIGDTSTAAIEVAERAIVPRARGGNQAVTLDQLNEAENRIINRAREEFELEPEIDPGHEFRYFRTFENTGDNQFDSGANMIPVTLPIGTIITNDENTGEVEIEYPTTGRGAGSRSSTGRRLAGTLYTSPGENVLGARGVRIPYNGSELGDTRLIGTRYAGYRPFNTPGIEQELWRHNEMWAAAEFEIKLRYRLTGQTDHTELTQRWDNVRLNFECWNHNILYHHRNIEGNTNGGDEAITAGPLLNYFAGAVGLQRTIGGTTQTAEAPGQREYQNGTRYNGGYVPGSYISIAPNITPTESGNDNTINDRLQRNQVLRRVSDLATNVHRPDNNVDMRPFVFTAIPCPWRIVAEAIQHVYMNGNEPSQRFPRAAVEEITNSGMFNFTTASWRNFQEGSQPRHMEPVEEGITNINNSPLIPEVFIEVGTAYGQIADMELEFQISNFRYMNEVTRTDTGVTAETICSALPRGTVNMFELGGLTVDPWGHFGENGRAATAAFSRENTALPPAVYRELASFPNMQPPPLSYSPWNTQTASVFNVYHYGFLYGGNCPNDRNRITRLEGDIQDVTHAQGFNAHWNVDDYAVAAASFNVDGLMTDPGTPVDPDLPDRHMQIRPVYSRPDTGSDGLFDVSPKFGDQLNTWSSARAFMLPDAGGYQRGSIVRSDNFVHGSTSTVDTSRLRFWVAVRDPVVQGGEVVANDRRGPATDFAARGFGALWVPLAWRRTPANPVPDGYFAPNAEEYNSFQTDDTTAKYRPGNYTRGRPPTFPGDFENYEITGLPVVFSHRAASAYGETNLEGGWRLHAYRDGDTTNIPSGPRQGQLGRFNPDVFHFRNPTAPDTNIELTFIPERSGSTDDSGNSSYIFLVAPDFENQGFPNIDSINGYLDPYRMTVTDQIVIGTNSTGPNVPNTRTDGNVLRAQQSPLVDRNTNNGILHCIPQSNLIPTGTHNRNTANVQEIYMPQLAVENDINGNPQWRADPVAQPREAPNGMNPGGNILDVFGWQDHTDFVQIDYQGIDDSGNPAGAPTNTRYSIISWDPMSGLLRISRVDDGSDTSTDRTEPQWTDTDNPFRNIARYVLGRRAGVDFLQAGTDPATRIAGEVSVIGEDGIEISTNTTEEQLIIGIDPAAFLVGPPDDPLMTPTDTGSPLPFGMFGLIDLFLGQQFSNQVNGMEQTVPDTDFSFFERYRRRGTSYYWYPNRAAVVTSDGTTQFIDRNTMFPPDGTGTRQTDLRLKAPTVFRDLAADNVERSITVTHPPIRGAVFGTTQVRLTWGGTDADMNPIMAPDVVPGRYYALTGTNNFDSGTQRIQLLFTSSAVTATDDFNWFLSTDRVVWAPGPDNAWVGGSPNFNMDTVLQHFPEDDFRVFEGIWQNYFGIELPDPDVGEWRVLLEG